MGMVTVPRVTTPQRTAGVNCIFEVALSAASPNP